MQGESEEDMKVKTAVKKYLDTDREIFLQSEKFGDFFTIEKKDAYSRLNITVIGESKVKRIDAEESDAAVTIYI